MGGVLAPQLFIVMAHPDHTSQNNQHIGVAAAEPAVVAEDADRSDGMRVDDDGCGAVHEDDEDAANLVDRAEVARSDVKLTATNGVERLRST